MSNAIKTSQLAHAIYSAIDSEAQNNPPSCVVRKHAGGKQESEDTKETVLATRAALAEYFTRQMWPMPISEDKFSFTQMSPFEYMVLHEGMPLGFVSRTPVDVFV